MADRDLTVHAFPGCDPAVGSALWMLEDTRRRTLDAVAGLRDDHVDRVPAGFENSIGALLYQLAAIEADWLHADILGVPYPDWMGGAFPHEVREVDGRLAAVTGYGMVEHLQRLALVRNHTRTALTGLTDDEFGREREVESGVTTPEWVLHHLRQHEAEHRGQIQSIRTALG